MLFCAHALELIDEGVVSLTHDFKVKLWSGGTERMFGTPASQATGKPLADVISLQQPSDRACTDVLLNQLPVPWKGEVLVRTLGKSIPVSMTFDAISQGETNTDGHYVLIFKDMQESIAIRDTLQHQQWLFTSAMDNSPDNLFGIDTQFRLIYFNSTYRNSIKQLTGTDIWLGYNLYENARSDTVRRQLNILWQKTKRDGKAKFNMHFQVPDSDTVCYYEISSNLIHDQGGQLIGLSLVSRDVTARTLSDARMASLEKLLQDREREEQQWRTHLLLEGQEMERRRLAAELHDGLGQMLNVLKMQVDSRVPTDTISQNLDKIIKEVVRINNNLVPLVLQDFGLKAALHSLLEQYRPFTSAELYCFTDLPNERLSPALETGIYRIVQEALSNATKHAHAQHISVQVTQTPTGGLLAMVEDNGTGFDYQPANRGSAGGYGILNMKSRVAALEGRLVIESRPGKGCVVSVELPMRTDAISY
ncbi:MAG: PAS domain-containing protein [Cytophagales bacterium]|nr:PAS domain-containing protein [Cytophagales bacterium]